MDHCTYWHLLRFSASEEALPCHEKITEMEKLGDTFQKGKKPCEDPGAGMECHPHTKQEDDLRGAGTESRREKGR